MSSGKVVQVIGAVIDVEFPRDSAFRRSMTPWNGRRSKRADPRGPAAAGRRRCARYCAGFHLKGCVAD